ncbi:MAG: hypothetical protein AB7U61_06100 [Methylocystis sp.]
MKKAYVGFLFQLLKGGFTSAVSILLSMIVFALIFKSCVTLNVSVDWANRISWISALAFHTVQPILIYAPILWFRRFVRLSMLIARSVTNLLSWQNS